MQKTVIRKDEIVKDSVDIKGTPHVFWTRNGSYNLTKITDAAIVDNVIMVSRTLYGRPDFNRHGVAFLQTDWYTERKLTMEPTPNPVVPCGAMVYQSNHSTSDRYVCYGVVYPKSSEDQMVKITTQSNQVTRPKSRSNPLNQTLF